MPLAEASCHGVPVLFYRDSDRRLEFFVGPGSRKQALWLALPKDLPDQSYSGNCSKIRNGAQKTWVPEVQDFTKGDTKVIASSPLRNAFGQAL
ncbi:MAG: hypothetical protein DMG38_25100 [Acidobacteria bacterium]|nr:MAG: hypothetical protein DMG38_25100 [Acidobacteriota bacterium]